MAAFIGDIVETLWKRNKDTSAEHQKEEVQTTLRRELGLPIENTDEIVDEEQPEDELIPGKEPSFRKCFH